MSALRVEIIQKDNISSLQVAVNSFLTGLGNVVIIQLQLEAKPMLQGNKIYVCTISYDPTSTGSGISSVKMFEQDNSNLLQEFINAYLTASLTTPSLVQTDEVILKNGNISYIGIVGYNISGIGSGGFSILKVGQVTFSALNALGVFSAATIPFANSKPANKYMSGGFIKILQAFVSTSGVRIISSDGANTTGVNELNVPNASTFDEIDQSMFQGEGNNQDIGTYKPARSWNSLQTIAANIVVSPNAAADWTAGIMGVYIRLSDFPPLS